MEVYIKKQYQIDIAFLSYMLFLILICRIRNKILTIYNEHVAFFIVIDNIRLYFLYLCIVEYLIITIFKDNGITIYLSFLSLV